MASKGLAVVPDDVPGAMEVAPDGPGSAYAIVTFDPGELKDALAANIGTDRIGANDLDRVKMPAGGGIVWEVPSLEGPQVAREIEGVIVAWRNTRAYWPGEYTGQNTPPQCSSDDGVYGHGDPGDFVPDHLCDECALSKFGSGRDGKGQACKLMRLLFIVTPDELLPKVIALPPTSVGPMKKYFLRLASKAMPPHGVVTALKLSKDTNDGGIAYSVATPEMRAILTPAERDRVKAYADLLKPALEGVRVHATDAATDAG